MTDQEALSVALHRTRHRVSEPGLTPEPCGTCRQEAVSILNALPQGWAMVESEAWRREMGSKTMAKKRYLIGLSEGAAAERGRLREAIRELLAD